VTAHTEGRLNDVGRPISSNASSELERIRRAAQLIATGTLSGSQSGQFAAEILRMVDSLSRTQIPAQQQVNARLTRLSTRERQVLTALASGHSVQEVAHQFCRSPKTINNQRTSVLRKLELRNTAELTRFAIRSGLVSV
jgi:DNA-binding NarL/FixJ family response regulator